MQESWLDEQLQADPFHPSKQTHSPQTQSPLPPHICSSDHSQEKLSHSQNLPLITCDSNWLTTGDLPSLLLRMYYFGGIFETLTVAFAADTVTTSAANNFWRVVHFALGFKLDNAHVSGTFAMFSGVWCIAAADSALQIASVVTFRRVDYVILSVKATWTVHPSIKLNRERRYRTVWSFARTIAKNFQFELHNFVHSNRIDLQCLYSFFRIRRTFRRLYNKSLDGYTLFYPCLTDDVLLQC